MENEKYHKRAYKRAVRRNKQYAFRLWLWETIGWRLSMEEPKEPSLIPRKPKKNERGKDCLEWTGFYTWEEMRDKVYPAFKTHRG